MRGIVQRRRAGGDEQLRHALFVQIGPDRHVQRRPKHAEDQRDLVAFDEAAHIFDRLRRRIAVVAADEGDLAAVDAALGVVQPLEIGGLDLAERAIGRGRAAIGDGLADLDLGIAGTGTILLFGQCRGHDQRRHGYAQQRNTVNEHLASSLLFFLPESVDENPALGKASYERCTAPSAWHDARTAGVGDIRRNSPETIAKPNSPEPTQISSRPNIRHRR